MTTKTNFQQKLDFEKAFDVVPAVPYTSVDPEKWALTWKLVKEEFAELKAEIEHSNGKLININDVEFEKLLKEAADLLYVVYGIFARFGVDADKVFALVHQANMSKMGPDGKPIRREDGKILKSENYRPADLSDIVLANQMGVDAVSTRPFSELTAESAFEKSNDPIINAARETVEVTEAPAELTIGQWFKMILAGRWVNK